MSFFFFSFLIFLSLVRSTSIPQNIKIKFLCEVVVLPTQFRRPKFFVTTPSGTLLKIGPPELIF